MTATSSVTERLVPRQRRETSTVRCARCGATRTIDLRAAVLQQVRPFVQEHAPCALR